MSKPAVFLDRDGTIIVDTGYVSDPAKVELLSGARESLKTLRKAGFRIVIVTNQSGIGRGYFTEADYHAVHARMLELLGSGLIDATYFCADHPDIATPRRKPGPGMLLEAAANLKIDLTRSWMVGDRESDVEAGHAAGTRSILLAEPESDAAQRSSAEFIAKDLAETVSFILGISGAS